MIEHISIPEERTKLLGTVKGWKEKLKEFLGIDIDIGKDITISGEAIQVVSGREIIRAFGRGFGFDDCLNLLDEEYFLEILDIGEFGKSKTRQAELKGRVIGEGGVTKKAIEKYADVKVAVYGKTVSMIGKPRNIRVARNAVEMILFGSKHNSVYRFLQENRVV